MREKEAARRQEEGHDQSQMREESKWQMGLEGAEGADHAGPCRPQDGAQISCQVPWEIFGGFYVEE